MPLVRISLAQGKPAAVVEALSNGVHQSLMETFNVPADDLFQIITEHAAQNSLVGPSTFLGITHTADLVFVQITCAEGRTVEQKKALYAAMALHLSHETGIRQEDVIISLIETKRENWSFGNGLASFV